MNTFSVFKARTCHPRTIIQFRHRQQKLVNNYWPSQHFYNKSRLASSSSQTPVPSILSSERPKDRNDSNSSQGRRPTSTSWLALYSAGATAVAASTIPQWDLNEEVLQPEEEPAVDVSKTLAVPKYATRAKMEQAVDELRSLLGEDAISIDDEILLAHGYSEWSTVNSDVLPVAVVFPQSTAEVSTIAKVCNKYRVPIVPYSGGSSVEGHFSAPYGGVSVDFMNMNNILDFHPEDMDVVVQPSLSWMDLNEKIKKSGLFFPIDPGPSAQIGGMVGTNCSGTNAVRYGTMRDWVLNLTVVLSDGTVVKTRRRPRKSSAGYSLNSLFVGSEGTLGMVTEATLKLAALPEETGVAVVTFPSIKAAAQTAIDVMHKDITIGAVEILDDVLMGVINRGGATGRTWKEAPTLFFKFSGSTAVVSDSIARVQKIAHANGGSEFEFEQDPEKQKTLWSARKEALWSMLGLRTSGTGVWSTDVAVPLSRLPELIDTSKRDLEKLGLFGSILGHVGDGNFHETVLFDGDEQRAKVEDCVHKMVYRALEMEGTCTGEHGIGMGKKDFLRDEVGIEALGVMQAIKKSLDPKWIMNPGKIFDDADDDDDDDLGKK